jgi:aspartate aminotransferase
MINEKMRALGDCRSAIRELFEYAKMRKSEIGDEKVFDFSLGNPSVEPPYELTESLISLINSENPTKLHGYSSADGDFLTRLAVANDLNERFGESITPESLIMTVGAASALASILTALVREGEEVICLTPYFPEYRVWIERCGGVVREVKTLDDFSPDISKIEDAINEKTALIIINSPNNPTGAVYKEDEIRALCEMLTRSQAKYKKAIYLVSDEPYRELYYTENPPPFVTKYYDNSLIAYSYSKSLSLPGERIGYALVCPRAYEFSAVRSAVLGAYRALGYVCAPSIFQKLIAKCAHLLPSIDKYRENGEILYRELTKMGYEAKLPEGAFYLFVKSPIRSAEQFSEIAKKFELILVPSDSFGIGGYVRISYCVKKETVLASLAAFANLYKYCEDIENG